MSNLAQTPANVLPGAGAKIISDYKFGATIVAGNVVYFDPTVMKWKLADNNVSALEAGQYGLGIALNGGSDGQPGADVQVAGEINLGAVLAVGESYYVSSAAGAICPYGDLSTNIPSFLGMARTAALLKLNPTWVGVNKA